MSEPYINVSWCLSPNFGDALNVWLVERISGKKVIFTGRGSGVAHHIVCGSILNWAVNTSIVWGAGLAYMEHEVCKDAQIKAVRGPLSYIRAKLCGCDIEPIWGDPALVLPMFYRGDEEHEKKYQLGVVPHYMDVYAASVNYGNDFRLTVIDPLQPVEDFIDAVLSCKRIISSSLHGLVVADAYKIPNLWCKFSDMVAGDGMKFWDHQAAMDKTDVMHPPHFVDLRAGTPPSPDALLTMTYQTPSEYRLREQVAKIWNACPFRGISV